MLKVIWLAPMPLFNASESHPAPWVITLAKALVDFGIKLTIINMSSEIQQNVHKNKYENIELIHIRVPKPKVDFISLYQLRIYRVRKYLKNIIDDFDILHIHGTEHQYEAMASGLKIPKVISIQGIINEYINFIPLTRYKQFFQWKLSAVYENNYIKKYHFFSCRTHWDSRYISSKNPEAKIFMNWEMIRPEFFQNNYTDNNSNILFVGGKNPLKGLVELLIAYNASIQSLGLKLIVMGFCTLDEIKKIINAHQLKNIDLNNIDCRGMQNSKGIIKAYHESLCLIHPTYIDNSPNSICEAQLSGLPVIATNVGGVSSLIEHNKTGLLIGKKVNDIECSVKILFENNELRKYISETSRDVARIRHEPEGILEKTLMMYREVIGLECQDVI